MSEILEVTTPEPTPKSYQCRHIHTAGRRCGSASLRGENFCYYHHTTRAPAPRMIGYASRELIFDLPPLEDRTSIRFAIAQVLSRIACNQLDHKRASLLLYGLQIAAITLPKEPRPTATSRYSRHDRYSRDHHENHDNTTESALIEDLILDPDLGPLAPIAEVAPPKTREKGFAQRLLEELRNRNQAADEAQTNTEADPDANAHADLNPDVDPEDANTETIPTIQAVATTKSGAPSSTRSGRVGYRAEARPSSSIRHKRPGAPPTAAIIPTIQAVAATKSGAPCSARLHRVDHGDAHPHLKRPCPTAAPRHNQNPKTTAKTPTHRDAILSLGLTVTPVALPRVSGSMRRWRNWQTH